jgi:hypothetical protein
MINAGLAESKIRAQLADLGSAPLVLLPAEFSRFVAGQAEKWAKVIRQAKAKAEQ